MTCKNCKHWATIDSNGSAQGDREMLTLGYKNCLIDNSKPIVYRFMHQDAKACYKYEDKIKNV